MFVYPQPTDTADAPPLYAVFSAIRAHASEHLRVRKMQRRIKPGRRCIVRHRVFPVQTGSYTYYYTNILGVLVLTTPFMGRRSYGVKIGEGWLSSQL